MSKLSDFKHVAVIECGENKYHYALYDNDIKVGDEVIVSGMNNSIVTIAEIITAEEVKERFSKNIIREVVCKVDRTSYKNRVANRNRIVEIQREMDKKIKKYLEENQYSLYAEKDAEIRELYAEYMLLLGGSHE